MTPRKNRINGYRSGVLCGASVGSLAAVGIFLFAGTTVQAADYNNTLGTTYYGQETAKEPNAYYCGAATAEMILATTGVGKNPAPIAGPPAQTTQDQLYTTAQANNGNNGRYYVNPAGLQGALATYDPPANGRSYVTYSISSYDKANRIMAYDIDHYAVTGGALLYKGGHWVNVYGIDTNSQPTLLNVGSGALTVNGFYIHDPWTGTHGGGLGQNAYLANAYKKLANGSLLPIGKWNLNFTPTNYGGTWQGNYCFVADPDPGDDSAINSAPDAVTVLGSPLDGSDAATDAATDLTGISGLADDASFENGSFSTSGETELSDPDGDSDWLVPYDQSDSDLSGAALIDADTGTLIGAYWDEGNLDNSLSAFDANAAAEDAQTATFDTDDVPVPEPTTASILCLGGVGLLSRRRRRI